MFWGFGYQTQTAIDGILDKSDVSLEMLLEEDDIIQECKGHHTKLIEFLSSTTNLSKMISFVTEESPELDETKQFKYALICCEIICCELWPILDGIINHIEILEQFWKFIETDDTLVPYRANCFSRISISLIQAKPAAMIVFIKSRPNSINNILNHILNSSISDLLLKLIFIEDTDESLGIIQWLNSENIISKLINKLDPNNEPEQHSLITQILLEINAVNYNQSMIAAYSEALMAQSGAEGATALLNLAAQQKPLTCKNTLIDEIKREDVFKQLINYMLDINAPYSTSSLINGINIIIELIRRYCSDVEQIEYQYHQYKLSLENNTKNSTANMNNNDSILPPTQKQLYSLATDINTVLHIINERLTEFKKLLNHPKSVTGPLDTTLGKQIPLGSERLRICELFAEIMHLQYLFTSSPLFSEILNSEDIDDESEKEAKKDDNNNINKEDGNNNNENNGVTEKEKPKLKSNPINGKRSNKVIVDELVEIGNRFTELNILPICLKLFFEFPWNNFLHSVVFDMVAKVFNTYIYSLSNPYSQLDDLNDISIPATHFNLVNSIDKPVDEDANNVKYAQTKMSDIRKCSYKLTISILKEGELTKKIVKAQRLNDFEVEQPRGVRLGYMGYLTHISDEICKLIDNCGTALNKSLGKTLKSDGWSEYVTKILPETKFKDCQPLGGERPNYVPMMFRANPFGMVEDVDNIGKVLSNVDGLDINDNGTPIEPNNLVKEKLSSNDSLHKENNILLSNEKITSSIMAQTAPMNQISHSSVEFLSNSHNSLTKSSCSINGNGSNNNINSNSNSNLNVNNSNSNVSVSSSNTKINNSKGQKKNATTDNNSDDDDDDIEGFGNVSVINGINSDQFARYICQQIVHDLPGKFLVEENSDDSDTDEEINWLRKIESHEDINEKDDKTDTDLPSTIQEQKSDYDNMSAIETTEAISDITDNDMKLFPNLNEVFETEDLRKAIESIENK